MFGTLESIALIGIVVLLLVATHQYERQTVRRARQGHTSLATINDRLIIDIALSGIWLMASALAFILLIVFSFPDEITAKNLATTTNGQPLLLLMSIFATSMLFMAAALIAFRSYLTKYAILERA